MTSEDLFAKFFCVTQFFVKGVCGVYVECVKCLSSFECNLGCVAVFRRELFLILICLITLTTLLFNSLMGTLKLQRNGRLYGSMMVGTLAVDVWAVTFGTARRGLGRAPARPVPFPLYQM